MAYDSKNDAVLMKIDRAIQYLAQAKDLMDVNKVIALAEAAKVYAKQVKASIETINRAAEIRLRAERRLGELLRETPKATGTAGQGRPKKGGSKTEPPKPVPTLSDSGISKKLSSRAQELASVPVEEFEEAIKVEPDQELNHNRVVKNLKEKHQRESRQSERLEAAKDAPIGGTLAAVSPSNFSRRDSRWSLLIRGNIQCSLKISLWRRCQLLRTT